MSPAVFLIMVIARLRWAAPQAKPIWVLGEKQREKPFFKGFF
jgi:hypothetical protein